MPVTYASRTPAAGFFGLGDEAECDAKKGRFRKMMEEAARGRNAEPVPCWMPELGVSGEQSFEDDPIAEDEFSAWD